MDHVYYCGKGYPIYLFGIEIPYGEWTNIANAINCEIKFNSFLKELKTNEFKNRTNLEEIGIFDLEIMKLLDY